jgi:dTMP kinase
LSITASYSIYHYQYRHYHEITVILNHFAVIEGCDGSGTTTQLQLLGKRFGVKQKPKTAYFLAAEPQVPYGLPLFFPTGEPTQGQTGLLIRHILKGTTSVQKETLARLFAADRGEHLYEPGGIVERCSRGELVVSDRYTPSSLVYQGLECGLELPENLNAPFPHPELLLYLDVDAEAAMGRIALRKDKQEIYEQLDFQKKVRKAYLELLPVYRAAGVRVVLLDGLKPQEELAGDIWRAVEEMPIMILAKEREERKTANNEK